MLNWKALDMGISDGLENCISYTKRKLRSGIERRKKGVGMQKMALRSIQSISCFSNFFQKAFVYGGAIWSRKFCSNVLGGLPISRERIWILSIE